jgi:hypothetical protein
VLSIWCSSLVRVVLPATFLQNITEDAECLSGYRILERKELRQISVW